MLGSLPISSIIQIVNALAAFGLVIILWEYRRRLSVRFLISLELCVAVWSISYAGEFVTNDVDHKIFWSQLSYLGIAFIPVYYFFFTTSFSQKKKIINIKYFTLSHILPIATIILVFTNGSHHLVWEKITFTPETNIIHYKYGWWFWIFYTYTFIFIVSGLYNLFSAVHTFTSYYKYQIAILLIGSSIPILANVIYVSKFNPYKGFDWTTISFVISGLLITLGIYKYQIFELVPLAKKKLIDTMGDGVIVVNEKGLVEDLNPASTKIFGIQKKKALNTSIEEVLKKHGRIINLLNTNEEKNLDYEINVNGHTLFYKIRISPILGRNHMISGKLIVINDVTTIREAELKLKHSNQQLIKEIRKNEKLIEDLDSFAHSVAHDLKNTLGSIYSSSEVITDSIEDNNMELTKEIAELLREMSFKAVQVTNEMLKVATAGHQDVEKVPVQMDLIISQSLKQLDDIIKEYNASIELPVLWNSSLGYAPWLEEVWVNYISNAIKYGGTPPIIIAGSDKLPRNRVKYWIRDNGNGIKPEDQVKLFQKHTRLNPEKALGYGLGLSIVKRIIEKLGGSVGIESSGIPGEGAEFYFILSTR